MKYWIFHNNEVRGPYAPEDLCRLPGYSAESLVCPEGRKGTSMGDWQRAGMAPALALSLVESAQLVPAGGGSAQKAGVYEGLPPEPTLKDLASLGSLQEKIALLEDAAARLQESLQAKENDILSLHHELAMRQDCEDALSDKIRELDEGLANAAKLRETLEKSVATEVQGVEAAVKELEAAVENQRGSISALTAELQALKSAALSSRAKGAGGAGAGALPASVASAAPAVPAPSVPAPVAQAQESQAPADNAFKSPFADFPPLFSGQTAYPEVSALPAAGAKTVPIPQAQAAKAKPVIVDMVAAPPRPQSRKRGLMISLAGLGLTAGGYLAYQAGFIPGYTRTAPAPSVRGAAPPAPAALAPSAQVAPAPPAAGAAPAPAAPAPAPSAQDQEQELKRRAIELVRSWPASDKTSLVGQRLEASAPPKGELSPWMAEKTGDNSFQVNFYGSKSGGGKQVVYEFLADLDEKAVKPDNAAAKALLFGEPAAGKARKVRIKPKKVKRHKPAVPAMPGMAVPEHAPPAPAEHAPTAPSAPAPSAQDAAAPGNAPAAQAPASPESAVPAPQAQDINAVQEGDTVLTGRPAPAPAPSAQDAAPSGNAVPEGRPAKRKEGADDAKLLDKLLQP